MSDTRDEVSSSSSSGKSSSDKVELIKTVLSDTPEELEEIDLKSVTKPNWKRSQFKTLHQFDSKLVAEMSEKAAREEYAAYQQVIQLGIKVPSPKLVRLKGNVALQMDLEPGETLDINKTDNPAVLLNIIVGTLNGAKVDTTEFGVFKLSKPPSKEVLVKLLEERSGEVADVRGTLRGILESSRTALISDLQVIVARNGSVTVIDPLWVGPPSGIKNQSEGMMFLKSYKRVLSLYLALGGEKSDIDAKDNDFLKAVSN